MSDGNADSWSEVVSNNVSLLLITPLPSLPSISDQTMRTLVPSFESPIISAVKLSIFMMIHSPLGTACVRSCSDVLRGSLVSIVGNSPNVDSELMAPFHAVVAKSRTNLVAQRKIAWVCRSMKKFEICMQPCTESKTKEVHMATIEQWESICQISRKETKAFGEFIGCERRHHERALKKCPALSVSSSTSLNAFCRRLNEYTDCYSKVPFHCSSKNATQIWIVVNQAVQRSYERILQLSASHFQLPAECEWSMRNVALNRPTDSEIIDDAEDRDEYEVESMSWKRQTSTAKSSLSTTTSDFWSLDETTIDGDYSHREIVSTSPTHPMDYEGGEYSVDDFWQGVQEVPLRDDPISLPVTYPPSTPLWARTTNKPNTIQRTPFLNTEVGRYNAYHHNSADRHFDSSATSIRSFLIALFGLLVIRIR
ncbi:hypothetical protein M3Y94_00763100 [Aphelenchoides besseyi]|nr:hypothetical protein M3Y94_00763100 [Aphelenchoides besseyi]KAI6232193.1 hypothetical protein M3Y95_00460800 [Aphelenchoides besseyi]